MVPDQRSLRPPSAQKENLQHSYAKTTVSLGERLGTNL